MSYSHFPERRNCEPPYEGLRPLAESAKTLGAGRQRIGDKTLMRGWSHAIAALGALLLMPWLLNNSFYENGMRIAVMAFTSSMILLYSISAVYHLGKWTQPVLVRLQTFDCANIFLFIAASYTPLYWATLNEGTREIMLAIIWLMGLTGVAIVLRGDQRIGRHTLVILYVGMGIAGALCLPAIYATFAGPALTLMLLSGLFYLIGAIIFASRWPNPFPGIFGFHELFHLFVIVGNIFLMLIVCNWALPASVEFKMG